MPSRLSIYVALVLSAITSGCTVSMNDLGAISKAGFEHETFEYQVAFLEGEGREFLPDQWRLANWIPLENTNVGIAGRSPRPIRVKGNEWFEEFGIDHTLDGIVEQTITLPRYDLYFESRQHDGRVWLKALPLSSTESDKKLEVFAQRYLKSLSGSIGRRAASVERGFGTMDMVSVSVEDRFGAKLIDVAHTRISGQPAIRATFERYDLEQRVVDPDHVETKSIVYFIKSNRVWEFRRSFTTVASFPILFVVAGTSDIEDFEATSEAVTSLVKRIEPVAR